MKFIGFMCAVFFGSASLYAQDIELTGAVHADDVRISGQMKYKLSSGRFDSRLALAARETDHWVNLIKVQLSAHAKKVILSRLNQATSSAQKILSTQNYPEKIELGMNGVPVLRQGMHGTCGVFANTAAVDAALNKGDYISQLCLLQLDNYLEKHAYTKSAWDGSISGSILKKLEFYGFVSKEKQAEHGCGGLTEYPLDGASPEGEMSLDEYHHLSESLNQYHIRWTALLDLYQFFKSETQPERIMDDVKRALSAGDRVTVSVLLMGLKDDGAAGAYGHHHAQNDTWVVVPELLKKELFSRQLDFGGHAMVVTGYNDWAVAIDEQGEVHRGLFTLRNSWGENQGNHGDFYMSYEYFKLLVMGANRIRAL